MPKPICTLCPLSSLVKTPVMRAMENREAPLQVFVDSPSSHDDEIGYWGGSMVSRLMIWMCQKLSLQPEEVGINFTLRCCGSELTKKAQKQESISACSVYSERTIGSAKALLGCGELSCMRLIGKPLAASVYQQHNKVLHCPVFISYSAGYALQRPGEVVDIVRMIFRAAVAAGLKPEVDMKLADFQFDTI